MRNVVFNGDSFKVFTEWQRTDKKIFDKIYKLIEECRRTPYKGNGKPEALKHELSGKYSRRINSEHRLVYEATDDEIIIFSCKLHY